MEFLTNQELTYYYKLLKSNNYIIFRLLDLEKQNIKNEQKFYEKIWQLIEYTIKNCIYNRYKFYNKLFKYYKPAIDDLKKNKIIYLISLNIQYNYYVLKFFMDNMIGLFEKKQILKKIYYYRQYQITDVYLSMNFSILSKSRFIQQIIDEGFSTAAAEKFNDLLNEDSYYNKIQIMKNEKIFD